MTGSNRSRGGGAGRAAAAWLAGGLRPEAKLRLFCLPPAGAGASTYRGWDAATPAELQVVPVQLPGREERSAEAPFRRVELLLDALEAGLGSELCRPYALFGHSLGAVLAFELARRGQERGEPPVHLFVSGRPAPGTRPPGSPPHRPAGEALAGSLQALRNHLQQDAAGADLQELLLPTVEADLELSRSYRWVEAPPLDCPLTALGGLADPGAPRADLEAWRRHTRGRFKVRMLPGDHFLLGCRGEAVLEAVTRDLWPYLAETP